MLPIANPSSASLAGAAAAANGILRYDTIQYADIVFICAKNRPGSRLPVLLTTLVLTSLNNYFATCLPFPLYNKTTVFAKIWTTDKKLGGRSIAEKSRDAALSLLHRKPQKFPNFHFKLHNYCYS